MSSTFVADNVDDKDESLIIIVNPDGTITVDPETLQKLIANQHQGNVSVVHMDGDGNSQLRADNQDGEHVNLTVEGFYPPLANSNSSVQINSQSHQHHQLPQHQVMQQPAATSVVASLPVAQPLMDNDILSSVADLGGEVVVDPFSEMDPEQLARLETALQSEQAKEILGHDLSDSILDVGGVLEDPTTVESMVHNDHSYVTTVVAQQPPRQQQAPVLQVVQLQPPSPQYSPDLQQLQEQEAPSNGSVAVVSPTRGMVRGRGRGKMGRIVSGHRAVATRGGLMRTDVSHVIRTLQQHQVVSNQGMLTNKTVGAGRKDVTQQEVGPRATPGTPQTPATAQPEQHKNAVEIVQKSDIAIVKKGAVLRRGGNGTHGGGRGSGRVVRGGRGGRRGDEVALKLEPREDLQLLDDEMAATLEAMHTDCSPTQPPPPPQPPDSSGGCDRAATIVTSTSSTEVPVMQHISNSTVLTPANLEMIKKREPSVVIKKLSLKTLESATGKKMAVIKALKAKDIIKPPQSATKASRKSADSTTSPQGGTKADLVEDVKKKKEKAKVSSGLGGSHHHHQSQQPQAPLVLGPELFSTPDIIRRVNSNSEKQHQAPVFPGGDDHHQKRLNPRKSDHQPPSQSHVSTTPTISIEATTISTSSVPSLNNPLPAGEVIMAESLLNTIHAEVAKESEVRDQDNKLADALLLDDLTNDGDAQYLKPASKVGNVESEILSSQIEETLERMETNGVHGNKLAVVPSSQPIAVDTVPTTNKIIIQSSNKRILHATDSALTQEVHNKNQLKKHAIVKEKKESPDSRKQATSSSGRKRKVTEKAAALQQEQQQLMRKKRKIVPSMDETTREPAVTREIPQLDPPPTYAILPSVQQQDSDSADSDVDSWNSEDDPDRLWCICQKPHNNRFMICCDTCEDWFHGKCVGVTKALGEQMEQRGIEWSCPNCRNGKYMNSSAAILSAFIPSLNSANSATSTISLSSGYNQHQGLGDSPTETLQQTKNSTEQTQIELLECRVCKKLARNNSIYCSDVCIRKHVLSMLVAIKTETDRLQSNSRVIVRERKSGRLLTGDKAPTVEGLVDWLLAHQMFEVVQPSMLPKQQQNLIQHSAAKSSPLQQQQTTATQNNKPKSARSVSGLGSSLKQTILTTKAPTASKIPFTIKQPVNQKVGGIQLIQPQPQIVSTPKGQRTSASDQVLTIDQSGKVKRVVIKPVADSTAVTVPQNNNSVPSGKSSYATKKVPGKTIGKREKKQRKVSECKVSTGATTATLVTTSSISTSTLVTTTVTSPIEPKKEELEPVRSNVRRTLHELLDQRAKQDKEINMLSAEISLLSVEIEEELYNYFKDTGAKYKSKYRSLVFNIKDPKNLTLYKKILGRSISPSQLVRLTPDELASQELAQWREKEAKHQLEIIKKNELDLIHQAKTVVLKSRKGEEVIETKNHEASISELESALNRTAEECEAFEKNLIVQGEKKETDSELSKLEEKLKSKAKENRRKSDSRKRGDRKNDKKRDQGWSRSKKRSRCHRSRSRSRHRSNHRRSPSENHPWLHDKNKDDEEEGKPQVSTEDLDLPAIDTKPEDTILLEGSDLSSNSSDREPSSTVIINTPPYNDAEEDDQGSDDVIPVWTGTLNMTEVTKVYTMAYEVSGGCEDLAEELSDHLECVGRIQPDSVWDYVSRMKKAGTKNIVVVRFASESQQEKMNYLALYSYLNNRNRMAVIGNVSKTIKDFYVLPLASHSPIPQVLLPLDGPGFDDYRPHLLLGIIIRSRKVSHSPLSSYSSRIKTKQVSYRNRTPERSYTPPLPTDTESTTPPISQVSHTPHLAMPDDDEPYSPGEDDDPYSPGGGEDETDISQSQSSRIESSPPSFLTKGADDYSLDSIVMSPDIMKNLEEVNRMIEQKRQQIQNITFGTTTNTSLQSEEEAYSPSESFTPPGPPLAETIPFLDSKTLPNINLPSNLHEILASIKSSTAAAAVIPQQKVKSSDPIVKAYKMYRGDDDEVYEEEGDCKNRMSPLSGPLPLNPSPETSPVTLAANRDPRQRPPELPLRNPALLSQLSDAELIRRAAVEMQPLPPLQPVSEESPSVYYPPPISMPPPPPLTYSHHQQPPPPLPLTPQSVAYSSYSPDTKFKYRENDKRSRQHHPRGGYHRGNGRPYRPYNRSFSYSRGRSGSPYYGRPPPSVAQVTLSHGLQSEWEEEIRNFEQRKSKAAERERRKRQLSSRSPSPSLRRRSPPLQPSHSRRRSHI